MYKLDLEKVEKPDIKLTLYHRKRNGIKKKSTYASLTMPKCLMVCIIETWIILNEMGIPDHITCLLRNLYAGQEATVRTSHGTTDWFETRKGVSQGCLLSQPSLIYMQSTSCEKPG